MLGKQTIQHCQPIKYMGCFMLILAKMLPSFHMDSQLVSGLDCFK